MESIGLSLGQTRKSVNQSFCLLNKRLNVLLATFVTNSSLPWSQASIQNSCHDHQRASSRVAHAPTTNPRYPRFCPTVKSTFGSSHDCDVLSFQEPHAKTYTSLQNRAGPILDRQKETPSRSCDQYPCGYCNRHLFVAFVCRKQIRQGDPGASAVDREEGLRGSMSDGRSLQKYMGGLLMKR